MLLPRVATAVAERRAATAPAADPKGRETFDSTAPYRARMRTLVVTSLAVAALVACEFDTEESTRFAEHGVELQAPRTWSSTGFSKTVWPRRLVAASYDVRPADVEGDCGGLAAVRRLPRDGVYVVLIDYGEVREREGFTDRLPVTLRDGALAEYECFGHSYMFRFIRSGRALQAHVGVGRSAPWSGERKQSAF